MILRGYFSIEAPSWCFPKRLGVIWLIFAPLLSGCSGFSADVEDNLAEYVSRLERVLEINVDRVSHTTLQGSPPKRALYKKVASVEINLTEFYTLQQCELGALVAQRNTVLGKQQDVAARFHYETRIADALGSCAQHVKHTRPALASTLFQWQKTKIGQRALHWANLIQTSDETHLAFTLSPGLLEQQVNKDAMAAINALGYLSNIETQSHGSLAELNRQLKILESSRLPAKVWRTQQTIAVALNNLTPAVHQALENLDCQQDSEKTTIARNVFYLYFIEKIQPVGSIINDFHYKMEPAMDRLLNADLLDIRYKAYLRTYHQAGFEAYKLAVQNHVQVWQNMLSRCGLSPTKR